MIWLHAFAVSSLVIGFMILVLIASSISKDQSSDWNLLISLGALIAAAAALATVLVLAGAKL